MRIELGGQGQWQQVKKSASSIVFVSLLFITLCIVHFETWCCLYALAERMVRWNNSRYIYGFA